MPYKFADEMNGAAGRRAANLTGRFADKTGARFGLCWRLYRKDVILKLVCVNAHGAPCGECIIARERTAHAMELTLRRMLRNVTIWE